MQLSVIIPVYNEAPWLRRCLDSLTPRAGVEFIAVDDHSTDGSDEICDEYSQKVKVIHQARNLGVSQARNDGIKAAKGKYITFLDSDDYMSEDGITNMLNTIKAHDDPLIQLNHLRYYATLDKFRLKYANRFGWYGYDNLPFHWCMVWNKVYKRDFILDNKLEFEYGMQYGEDAQFNLECLLHTDHIQCVKDIGIVHCFENKNSLIHNITEEKLLKQMDLCYGFLKREALPSGYKSMIRGLMAEWWDSQTYKNIINS